MMISYLKTEKTARVVVEGVNNPELKQVWIIAHGYGQLATFFINKFKNLFSEQNLIIAPEGLHRYYRNGLNDKVGASWMTKEERENDIDDNCAYLDKIYETYISPLNKKVIINVLGFSQGGATVCRWVANTRHNIDNVVLWGCEIPADSNWKHLEEKKSTACWFYAAGDADEFLSIEKQKEQILLLEKYNLNPFPVFYKGQHDIQAEVISLLTQKCVKNT